MRLHASPTILLSLLLGSAVGFLPETAVQRTRHTSLSSNINRIPTNTHLQAATGISLGDANMLQPEPAQVQEDAKVGVLFLNLGGPTTGEDVEGTTTR